MSHHGLDLSWLALGCLLLGAACGAVFRLLSFLAIAAVLVAVLLASGAASGHALAATIIVIVGLQVGYGLGVIARAAVRNYLSRRRGTSPIDLRSRR